MTHSAAYPFFDEPEAMEEERRLFYVGITRAEDRLYLLRPCGAAGEVTAKRPSLPVTWMTSHLSCFPANHAAGIPIAPPAAPRPELVTRGTRGSRGNRIEVPGRHAVMHPSWAKAWCWTAGCRITTRPSTWCSSRSHQASGSQPGKIIRAEKWKVGKEIPCLKPAIQPCRPGRLTWPEMEPYFQELAARSITAENVQVWLADWSSVSERVEELYARLAVATSTNTADKAADESMDQYLDTIYPNVMRPSRSSSKNCSPASSSPGF